jgi:hypothetical protein
MLACPNILVLNCSVFLVVKNCDFSNSSRYRQQAERRRDRMDFDKSCPSLRRRKLSAADNDYIDSQFLLAFERFKLVRLMSVVLYIRCQKLFK